MTSALINRQIVVFMAKYNLSKDNYRAYYLTVFSVWQSFFTKKIEMESNSSSSASIYWLKNTTK